MAHGVTHGVIRKAAGLWARQAVVQWHQRYPEAGHLLIGETPFVGIASSNSHAGVRMPLSHCCRRPVSSCRCLPGLYGTSSKLNASAAASDHSMPRNAKTRPPRSCVTSGASSLALLQRSVLRVALSASTAEEPYDPALYQTVYQRLLTQRQVLVRPMDIILPTTTLSVYDFAVPRHDVVPTAEEVARFIGEVEQQYPNLNVLQQDIDRWYMIIPTRSPGGSRAPSGRQNEYCNPRVTCGISPTKRASTLTRNSPPWEINQGIDIRPQKDPPRDLAFKVHPYPCALVL